MTALQKPEDFEHYSESEPRSENLSFRSKMMLVLREERRRPPFLFICSFSALAVSAVILTLLLPLHCSLGFSQSQSNDAVKEEDNTINR